MIPMNGGLWMRAETAVARHGARIVAPRRIDIMVADG